MAYCTQESAVHTPHVKQQQQQQYTIQKGWAQAGYTAVLHLTPGEATPHTHLVQLLVKRVAWLADVQAVRHLMVVTWW